MPNLNAVLKSEITRLARKEIRSSVDPLRKSNLALRREVAELKRHTETAGRDPKALVEALTGIEAIFGTDLPGDLRFTKPVTAHLASLLDKGAKATAASLG